MPVTLDDILAATRAGLPAVRARRATLERVVRDAAPVRDFAAALRRPTVALIAEVKRRSPSAGAINEGLDPVALASAYARAGAAAVSVLTDGPHFGGSLDDLAAVAGRVAVPALRKDFILDEAQVLEARAAGASAVLLIVRALPADAFRRLLGFAADVGLAALVEVHTAPELDTALAAGARLIGVNSRDLDTFRIETDAAWTLVARVPADCIAIAESGMASVADVARAADAGADAVLIGSALSAAPEPEGLARAVAGVPRRGR